MLADSVGLALLVVLDTLTPAERLAFVLHDLFGVPYEEIAPIVDRSVVAALVDGAVQLVWQYQGKPVVVFAFTIDQVRITAIDLIADQERLQSMHVQRLRS